MRSRGSAIARMFGSALALFTAALVSCSGAPSTLGIPAVSSFDRELFNGRWFEIARIPIPVARDWVGTSDTYLPTGDGTWTVLYEGYKGTFDGKRGVMKQALKTPDPLKPGEMLASPLPFIWLPYRLVWWNAADRIMLITSNSMDFLWVMSKDAVPVPSVYEAAAAEAKRLGFDISRLEKVAQRL